MYIISFSFTVSPVLFLVMELSLVCLQVVHFSFPPLVVSIIATSQANTGQLNFFFKLEISLKGMNLDKIWKRKPLFPLKKGLIVGKHHNVSFCQPWFSNWVRQGVLLIMCSLLQSTQYRYMSIKVLKKIGPLQLSHHMTYFS